MASRTAIVLALIAALFIHAGRAAAQILQKPVITVAASLASVPENPSGNTATSTTAAVFTFDISQAIPADFPIQYSVSGSAVNGKDYQSLTGVVTIRAGRTSASITVIPIDDSEDETDETVVVAVAANSSSLYTAGSPANATMTILDDDDVRILDASFAPDTVLGGRSRDLRITLNGAAPAGGLSVRVQTANTAIVSGGIATIAAGTRVGVATLATQPVANSVRVTVIAQEPNGSSATTALVVLTEPTVSRMNFRRPDTYGGGTITGSVAIDAPAPPGGISLPVVLTSQSKAGTTGAASAPATLDIPAGASGATLSIATVPVKSSTQVVVTVGSGSKTGTTTIGIHPIPVIQTMSVTPDPASSSGFVDVTVRLAEPAPTLLGGWTAFLTGSGPVEIPADNRLLIAAGTQEATIRLGTNSVSTSTVATVGASEVSGQPAVARATFTVQPPGLSSLFFKGQNFWGGQGNTGTMSLGRQLAPPGGFTAPITMSLLGGGSGPVPAAGPATVTIPAGQNSTGFSITTQPVSTPTLLLVTAGTGSGAVSDTLELHPVPTVQTFDITPDPSRGDSVDVQVRLNVPNGADQYYTLFVTATGPVQIPSLNRIVFTRGVQENSLRIGVDAVPKATQANVNLSRSSTQPGPWIAAVIVSARAPRSVHFKGQNTWGGQSNTGTVSIDRNAPSGGFEIPITVSGVGGAPARGSAPATVTIPAGQNSIGFTVQTQAVTTETALVFTARTEAGAVADTIGLYPRPTLQSVRAIPDPVFGGDDVDIRVRLDVPNGADQFLTYFVTGTGPLQIPSSNRIVFERGGSEENGLKIGTGPVTSPTPVTITITGTGTQPEVMTTGFTILPRPPLPTVAAVSFNQASVIGGTAVPATVVLSGPVPAGQTLQLNLAGVDPVQTPSPSTVVIPAGQASAMVSVQTRAVTQTTQGSLRVATPAGTTVTGSISVEPRPATLATLELNPASLEGGRSGTARIELSGPAPAGGLTVSLTTDNPQVVSVPASVTVTAGATSASFSIPTLAVRGPTNVRITATEGARQAVQMLTVNAPPPPTVTLVSADPANAIGGSEIELTVRLSRTADAGGFTVPVSSTDPAVIPGPAVYIGPGFQAGRARVRTAAVPAQRSIRVGVPGAPGADIVLRPVPVERVQTPGSVRSGEAFDAEIRLLEPAPAGGLRIPVASSDPSLATAPPFVDVPAGATSATVRIQTIPGADGQVTITAGLGPSAGSREVRIR